jgi:pyrroline-5-carboxylate reductase
MKDRTVGFVGGGRVTAILLEALGEKRLNLGRVTVSDTSPEVLAKRQEQFPGITATPDNGAAASSERVFLALHPPALKEALPPLAGAIREDAVVVSLAPVLTFEKLTALLKGFDRLARVIPNAPSVVGAGYNPVAFGPGLPADAHGEIESLLDPLGAHPVVPEEKLEAYAVLAAMGPTYFWFQWQALRDLAGSFGLGAAEGDEALRAMLEGSTRTFFDSRRSYEEVADLIPVKPLADVEPQVRQAYAEKLGGLYRKLKGT